MSATSLKTVQKKIVYNTYKTSINNFYKNSYRMIKQSKRGKTLAFWGLQMKSTWEFVIQFFAQFCNLFVGLKDIKINNKKLE